MWKPAPDPEFAVKGQTNVLHTHSDVSPWQGWLPWLIVTAIVILWTTLEIFKIGAQAIHWPGLDKAISITLYNDKPYAAVWAFQPLSTGTAILLAAIVTALVVKLSVADFFQCVARTFKQAWIAILTVCLIIGLAFLMNYSGMAYTLGLGASSVGHLFVILSPFLGWVAVALSGSDTSGNALFGNLQVVAAKQLNLDPVLFAATNSSGGVMGKMISPQNIATGVSVTDLRGQEGVVFARTFWHSIILTLILSVLVVLQQYVFPWMIPRSRTERPVARGYFWQKTARSAFFSRAAMSPALSEAASSDAGSPPPRKARTASDAISACGAVRARPATRFGSSADRRHEPDQRPAPIEHRAAAGALVHGGGHDGPRFAARERGRACRNARPGKRQDDEILPRRAKARRFAVRGEVSCKNRQTCCRVGALDPHRLPGNGRIWAVARLERGQRLAWRDDEAQSRPARERSAAELSRMRKARRRWPLRLQPAPLRRPGTVRMNWRPRSQCGRDKPSARPDR